MEQPVFVGKQCLSPQYSNHYYCREQAAFFLSHFLSAVESPVTIYGFYVRFVLHLWFGPGQLQRSLHCAHIQFMFHSSSFASLFRGRQTWYTRIPTHRELYSILVRVCVAVAFMAVACCPERWRMNPYKRQNQWRTFRLCRDDMNELMRCDCFLYYYFLCWCGVCAVCMFKCWCWWWNVCMGFIAGFDLPVGWLIGAILVEWAVRKWCVNDNSGI